MSELSLELYEFLNRLVDALRSDKRIEAIWLEGSLARGDADPYSDVDLHAYVPFRPEERDGIAQLRADLPDLLSSAGRVAYLRALDGRITTGMMADGKRFDVALETEEDLKRPRPAVKILYDRTHDLYSRLRMAEGPPSGLEDQVAGAIQEFWRCIALLPTVLARGELLVAFQGHAVILGLAAEVALGAEGRFRSAGAKRLNSFLLPEDRAVLEDSLPPEPTLEAITAAQVRLARWMTQRGRECAGRLEFAYPEELEAAAMRYLSEELTRFGLADLLRY
ncbi:MAG: aminoglycoside 6-adenylyltransferase [Armatimonadetes bacterium]|nr:aminoglycoside 6-adenylyltransferase [Armatimonadota bacterium]